MSRWRSRHYSGPDAGGFHFAQPRDREPRPVRTDHSLRRPTPHDRHVRSARSSSARTAPRNVQRHTVPTTPPLNTSAFATVRGVGKTIYVVTHPEATHHAHGLVGGWYDSDLTLKGLADAKAIAQWLYAQIPAGVEVDIFSSDLLRARRTADQISDMLGTAVTLDQRLREKSYGTAQQRPQRWLDERFIPPPATGDRLSHDEGIPGAETKAAFAARVYAAMETITARTAQWQVIVTHGFALSFVITAWIQMPLASLGYASFRSEPGSITTLRQDDYFQNRQVAVLADTHHLDHTGRDDPTEAPSDQDPT